MQDSHVYISPVMQSIPLDVYGSIYFCAFTAKGGVENEWISPFGTGFKSSETSFLVPWKSKIVGLTYVNKKETTNINTQIWAAAENLACSPIYLMYQWNLRSTRVARKTNFTTDIIFNAGDKVGVYYEKYGGNKPENSEITIYFQIIDSTGGENYEDYSCDLARV